MAHTVFGFQRLSNFALTLLGVVISAVTASGASLSEFATPFAGVTEVKGPRSTLVILLHADDPAFQPNNTRAVVYNRFFGPRKSVATYFDEVSLGQFSIEEAFVTPWLTATDDPATAVDESSSAFLYAGGFVNETTKSAWVIQQVEAMTDFQFSDYDANGDGLVTERELAIYWVFPGNPGNARARGTDPALVPVPSLSQGVQQRLLGRGSDQTPWATITHELGHTLLGLSDLYIAGTYPGVGEFSLMCNHRDGTHLDPWARMKLGWIKPEIVTEDGWFWLSDAETSDRALILHDKARGSKEYFIVENRWPGNSHEDFLAERGIALWRIDEQDATGDWGRKTIDLVWANGPPQPPLLADTCPTPSPALFDGSNQLSAASPAPDWRSGGASGVSLWHLPPASNLAAVYVDIPPRQPFEMVATDAVMAGTPSDLDGYRPSQGVSFPEFYDANRIIASAIASDDRVFTWFDNKKVSIGSSRNLAEHRAPYGFSPPEECAPSDILGIGIASDDRVYAWCVNGKVSAGASWRLDNYRSPESFTLPPGYVPQDIVAMAIAPGDAVNVWYRDGKHSIGSSLDLDAVQDPSAYSLPLGRVPADIAGAGIASDGHTYVWLRGRDGGAPVILTASLVSGSTAEGMDAPLLVKAADAFGNPLVNVAVRVSASTGAFSSAVTSKTNAAGLAQFVWTAPDTAPLEHSGQVILSGTGQRTGFAEGRFSLSVPVIVPFQ